MVLLMKHRGSSLLLCNLNMATAGGNKFSSWFLRLWLQLKLWLASLLSSADTLLDVFVCFSATYISAQQKKKNHGNDTTSLPSSRAKMEAICNAAEVHLSLLALMGPQHLSKTHKTHSLPLSEESTIDSRRRSSLQIIFASACASFDSLVLRRVRQWAEDDKHPSLVHSVYIRCAQEIQN